MNTPHVSQKRVADQKAAVDLIREAFHYQSRFEGSTMVFKIDCPVTEDPRFPSLMKDMALLAQTGFRVVIVPGAKERIDAVLKEYGIVSNYLGNVRITTAAAMPFVEMAAFHAATRFMTLSASRVDAVMGNFVRARGLGVINGTDMAHTGTVDKVLLDCLERALKQGMVPILPCIGWSPAGRPYNVPSDEIALAVSAALGAIKLFIVSINGGLRVPPENAGFGCSTGSAAPAQAAPRLIIPKNVEIDETGRIIRLTPQDAGLILEQNKERGQEKSLCELKLALDASRTGVERIHLIDGREEGAVLRELFSNMGAGTMLFTDEYEAIRELKSADVPDVLRLMEPLMQKGILLRRTGEQIQEKKADYVAVDIDGSLRACAALHDWGEKQAEIAAIATDPAFAAMGLGRRIVRFLIERAKKNGFRRVFVLTATTHDWFEALGFTESPVESLPPRKRKVYDQARNSKVFALELNE